MMTTPLQVLWLGNSRSSSVDEQSHGEKTFWGDYFTVITFLRCIWGSFFSLNPFEMRNRHKAVLGCRRDRVGKGACREKTRSTDFGLKRIKQEGKKLSRLKGHGNESQEIEKKNRYIKSSAQEGSM